MPRLAPQPWMTAAPTVRVMQALERARPGCARFVGGCVRNALLGRAVADIDICTQLTPEVVANVLGDAGMAVHPTGIEHGTLTIVADHHPFEVTTLRRDVETDGRRATVAFTEDWAEDAQRRDFRINALYCSADGDLFDPTGGGLDDIAARRVIFVGDAETRLREDYLRILRFYRFYAWYADGAPDAAGQAACARLVKGLQVISAERIWSELKKLLAAPDPLPALAAMQAAGVFQQILPDSAGTALLSQLVGIERAKNVPVDPMLRFFSLFGKNEAALAAAVRKLKMSNDERDRLVFAARLTDAPTGQTSAPELRRILYQKGAQAVRDTVIVAWAKDPAGPSWPGLVAQAESYVRPAMPVSGDDVIARGISAGPEVGDALRKLEQAWIDSDFQLSKDALLAKL